MLEAPGVLKNPVPVEALYDRSSAMASPEFSKRTSQRSFSALAKGLQMSRQAAMSQGSPSFSIGNRPPVAGSLDRTPADGRRTPPA